MRPWLLTIAFSLITFAVGLLIGRHWPKPSLVSTIHPAPVSIAETPAHPLNNPTAPASPLSEASPIDRLTTLAWFKANGFPNIEINIADLKGLTPEFIRFFNLSSAEQQAILTALENAKRQSLQIASQAAQLTGRPTADDLVIEVPALPESGGKIYDDLLHSLRDVLGPDRYSYFDLFSGKEVERKNDSYGTKRKKYEIHREQGASNHVSYSLKISVWELGTDGTMTIQTSGTDSAWLANTYPEIAEQIPSDFKTKPSSP